MYRVKSCYVLGITSDRVIGRKFQSTRELLGNLANSRGHSRGHSRCHSRGHSSISSIRYFFIKVVQDVFWKMSCNAAKPSQ